MGKLKYAVVGVLALYVLLCIFVYFIQRSLVFPAPSQLREPTAEFEILKTDEGGMMMASRGLRDQKTVVYFHGNGEQVSDVCDLGVRFLKAGIQFVAVEYPGYPLLKSGQPSEASLIAAGEGALRFLEKSDKVSRPNIVLLGQSLGSGVAVELAQRKWGTRLVLVTPYTRLPDVAKSQFWFLPVTLLMKDVFDSESKAASIKIPVLVVHGTADEVVHFELGKQLSGTFPSSQFFPVEDGHHNGLWNTETVFQEVLKFVTPRSKPFSPRECRHSRF